MFGEEIAKELVNFFKEEAAFKNSNGRKYKNLKITDPISKILNSRKHKITKEFLRILRKYLSSQNHDAAIIARAVASIEKDIQEYINLFYDVTHSLMDPNSLDRIQHTIDALNSFKIAKLSISGLGFMLEKIFNYLILENIISQYSDGGFVLSSNGKPLYSVSGTSTSNTGHGVTTDNVITIFGNGERELRMGFSLKAVYNKKTGTWDSSFNKTVYGKKFLIKKGLYPTQDQLQRILYYAANEQAFTVFMAPHKYSRVITNAHTGEIELPPNVKRAKGLDITYEIRAMFVILMFIKGLLGAIFLNDDFVEDIEANRYTPPIFLSFVEQDFFTYKILERLITFFKTDIRQLREIAHISKLNFNFTENQLIDLFLTKKMTESTSANRYDDLLNNKVEYPYLEYAPYSSVMSALSDITRDITVDNLEKFLFRPVNFRFAVNSFLNK